MLAAAERQTLSIHRYQANSTTVHARGARDTSALSETHLGTSLLTPAASTTRISSWTVVIDPLVPEDSDTKRGRHEIYQLTNNFKFQPEQRDSHYVIRRI